MFWIAIAMASIPQRMQTSAWWPGVAVFGVALLVATQVESSLWLGGLAPLAVAAVIAAFLGVPIATSEWQLGPDTSRLTWPLGETLLLLAVGAAIGSSVAEHGSAGIVLLVVGWPVLGLATYKLGYWPGLLGAVIAVVVAVTTVGVALPSFDAWTLLEPHWESWDSWLPWSVTAGLLLATAGLGRWAAAPSALPGHRRVPWAATALGLLAALAATLAASIVAEGTSEGLQVGLITGLFHLGIAATLVTGPSEGLRRRVGIALGSSLWFASPGLGGLQVFWGFLLPIGLAITIGSLAVRLQGQASWTAWVACAAALAAALLGWPGVPSGTVDAAAAAATLVAMVWIVGTRSVLASQTA